MAPMLDRMMTVDERYENPHVLPVQGRDERWLERAKRVAESVNGKWRVGCVIVRGSRVLAVAANTQRNEASTLDGCLWHSSVHAEMAALRQVAEPAGATAYVARLGRDGRVRHAQPCIRCRTELAAAGVDAVWTSDPQYVAARQEKSAKLAG